LNCFQFPSIRFQSITRSVSVLAVSVLANGGLGKRFQWDAVDSSAPQFTGPNDRDVARLDLTTLLSSARCRHRITSFFAT
jgi:hypothetical protein